jgi:hypothetical protein
MNQDWFQKSSVNKSCRLDLDWTFILNIAPWIDRQGSNFLSLATCLGLYEYVTAKVRKGCVVIKDGKIWPLLLDAILFIECEKPLALLNSIPNKRIVKVLLNQGADLN